jgi:hypothetical protein
MSIKNAAFDYVSASISSFTAAGDIGTVTRTAHGRSVGDYVAIEGATMSGYNGVYRVETVPNADTYTVKLPITPDVTTATGTMIEYTADQDISIIGEGVIDANGANQTPQGNNNDHGIMIVRCARPHVDVKVKNPRKFAYLFGNCRDMTTGVLKVQNDYSDGIHLWGPIINADIGGLMGYTGDDFFAITMGEYAAYEMFRGDVYGVRIGILGGRTALAGVKIAGNSPFSCKDVRIDKFRMYCGNNSFAITTDTNLTQTNVGSVHVGEYEELNPAANKGGVFVNTASGTTVVDSVTIDHVYMRLPANVNWALFYTGNVNATLRRASAPDLDVKGPTAGVTAAPRIVRQVGPLSELHIGGKVENFHSVWDHDSAGSETGQRIYSNGLRQIGCNVGVAFRRNMNVYANGWSLESTGTAAFSAGSGTLTLVGDVHPEAAGKHANLSGTARIIPFTDTLEIDGDFVTAAKNAKFWNNDSAWSLGSGTDKTGFYGYTGSAWTKLFGPA